MTLQQRYRRDRVVVVLSALATAAIIVPLIIIIGYVFFRGIGALNVDFFTEELGSPMRARTGRATGLVHSIYGTIVIDLMALFMAIPFGLGAGVMLSEFPDHRLNPTLRVLASTLNGMPAVLIGLIAFSVVVRPMGNFSALAGSVALAFLMIPIIARSTESVLRITPWTLREAGLALGLPRWRVTLSLIIPASRTGLITGVMIAFARAAGEAAPLLFTSFGQNYMNTDITRAMDTLPQRLYSLAISPYSEWHSMGWAAGIVLLVFVMSIFLIARIVTVRFTDWIQERVEE